MKNSIIEKITALRKSMKENGVEAFLVNGSDPHMSEYVPMRWQTRAYISGFTGSYGWLAITLNEAVLWTDSRYFLQAEEQLDGTGIEMLKARLPESIPTEKWLAEKLERGNTVAFDGSCYSMGEVSKMKSYLGGRGIKMKADLDLIETIWENRPGYPTEAVHDHLICWAGKSRIQKFEQILSEATNSGADTVVLSALDDVAWTLNIRGADVPHNPVTLGYAIINQTEKKLFVDQNKISKEVASMLRSDGIELFNYDDFFTELALLKDQKIYLDSDRSSYKIMDIVTIENEVIEGVSIPSMLKALKNEAELEGMRLAMKADGIALLNFQLWLQKSIKKGKITEYDIAVKLDEFRAKQKGYKGSSFFPIVGYKDHGAVVHIHVTPEIANTVKAEGILLFDSGGQYEFGTTDITRTIALGEVNNKMISDFTLVLKGMINLSNTRFLKGTKGCQLDVIARAALWQNGLNYGHGTGHGVGAYLNVHEGPMSIRQDMNSVALQPGMVLSNEPGLYRKGEYGLRTENVIVCCEDESNEFGDFLRFETLTLYPIDLGLVDTALLTKEEIEWINNYHVKVYDELSVDIDGEVLELLKHLTQPIFTE